MTNEDLHRDNDEKGIKNRRTYVSWSKITNILKADLSRRILHVCTAFGKLETIFDSDLLINLTLLALFSMFPTGKNLRNRSLGT